MCTSVLGYIKENFTEKIYLVRYFLNKQYKYYANAARAKKWMRPNSSIH